MTRRLSLMFLVCAWLSTGDATVATAQTLWSEDAESGATYVLDNTTGGYSLIQSDVVGQGNYAFHLAHPNQEDNWFTIDQTIGIQSDTKLFFLSRLGVASSTQFAQVQISTNGGTTWPTNIFSQPGSGPPGEGGFSLKQIDLSAYSGQNLRFRFFYDLSPGTYYPGTNSGVGWYVDDIQIGSELQKSQWSIGDPTAHEQQYLEYVNRARADAVVEANRLANETDPDITSAYSSFGITGQNIVDQFQWYVNNGHMERYAQPLSFNSALLTAAQLHTQDMFDHQFQGHNSSSSPPAPFPAFATLGQRLDAVGYSGGAGENVYSYADSVAHGHAGFDVDWGDTSNPASPAYNPAFAGQGMQNPSGHRINIHNGDFSEAGIGVINGTNGSVGPQLVTQDFGNPGVVRYITGAVYEDLNGNSFYDIGEGREGVRIDVDGSAYFAISTDSGGYSVPVSEDGQYEVTFSGGNFATYSTNATVSNGWNTKVDYLVLAATLDGDFNGDGIVNAADYVRWRDTMSDNLAGYDTWRTNFGAMSGSGTGELAAVPEPATAVLVVSLGIVFLFGGLVNTGKRRARFLSCVCRGLLVTLCCFPFVFARAGEIEVAAQFGDSSPDGNGTLELFAKPALNDAGQVGFLSQLAGTSGGADDNIVWLRAEIGELTIAARKGLSSLDGDLISSHVSDQVSIDGSGRIHSIASVAGPPQEFVAFVGDGDALTSISRLGDASPSGNNSLVSTTFPSFNDGGIAAFKGTYTGANAETGIYTRTPDGMLSTRLLSGTAAPRGGTVLVGPTTGPPTLNETAQVAVRVNIDDGMTNPSAIVRLDGSTVVELARVGDVADDTTITSFITSRVPINDDGTVAFAAQYTQPSISRTGVFLADADGITLIAEGILPGSATAVGSVVYFGGINQNSQVAFGAEFVGGIDPLSGIYVADPSGPELVALEDTLTPAGDKYFRHFLDSTLSFNESGQLAFAAQLSDTPNGSLTEIGLYFYDPESGLEQIARTGAAFMNSTFTNVVMTGPNHFTQGFDTTFSSLNNAGQVAFAFVLEDSNTGIAIWSPEAPLLGDYNEDGVVNAADYVVWRNRLGSDTSLLNDDTEGVGQDDYDRWVANFGAESGAASSSTAAVPEPTTLCLLMGVFSLGLPSIRRAWGQVGSHPRTAGR